MNKDKKNLIAEGGRSIRSKRWILCFFLIILIGCPLYMLLNYHANPLGYFTTTKGLNYNYADDYTRSIKSRYILAHKDEIEGVVLGGSKAGVIDPQLLTELSGIKYYNMYNNIGNFADYKRAVTFLCEKTDVKEILIHLSIYETTSFDQTTRGANYEVPAEWGGSTFDKAKEFMGYLMTDMQALRTALTSRANKGLDYAETLSNGMKNRLYKTTRFLTDPDAYVNKYVLRSYDTHLKKLFVDEQATQHDDVRYQNLVALREMKQLCDEHGVTLRVVFSGSFIGEKYLYECADHYDYIAGIVDIIGEVWDFSGYCDVNRNPYNFIDYKHTSNAVADLMIKTMYGADKKEGFGVLLTPDNVYDYLNQRRADYETYKKEYEETGTIALETMEDDSYIPWVNGYIWKGERDKTIVEDDQLGIGWDNVDTDKDEDDDADG